MAELALYVLPRAIDSLFMILRDRKIFTGFRFGEVALFSASMSVMMYCYEVRPTSLALMTKRVVSHSHASFAHGLQREKESVSPFLFSIMKRFLATAADKKRAYLATLRQKKAALAQQQQKAPEAQQT